MLTVLLRATILFFSAVVVMRMMGKRQIGQLQPYELVIAITIAELAASPMEDVSVPLLYGILPMLVLLILHSAFSILSMKSQTVRAVLNGRPSILIKNGIIQKKEMCRCCYDLNDLLEEMRAGGVLNPAEVGTMILETSGKVSVFPKAQYRAASPQDLQLTSGYEGIPLTLILDGKVEKQNLETGGVDEAWLMKKLGKLGFSGEKEILLATLDTAGMLFVQTQGKTPRLKIVRVMEPEEVCW